MLGTQARHLILTLLLLQGGLTLQASDLLWGCEKQNPDGLQQHIVVATLVPDPAQLLPWLWQVGLTGAAVHIYHRSVDVSVEAPMQGVVLPCNMTIEMHQLLPNKGRESAPFFAHIINYWDSLPHSLIFVHDHGPASRHSLCGPWYRRVRGYHRGIGEEAEVSISPYSRLLEEPVSLSSGCIETWSRGCCGQMVCLENDKDNVCPFEGEDCTAKGKSKATAFMYHRYFYDWRVENKLVLPSQAKPTGIETIVAKYESILVVTNYTYQAQEDYPGGHKKHQKSAYEHLGAILDKYQAPPHGSMSCCASLIVRSSAIQRWAKGLYQDLFDFCIDESMGYHAAKAFEFTAWRLWRSDPFSNEELANYALVDELLSSMRGCPGKTDTQQAWY